MLKLMIRNRDKELYREDVESITSFNKMGRFDVLREHANFITLVERELIYRDKNGDEHRIPVTNGIMKVRSNNVNVFLGIGV